MSGSVPDRILARVRAKPRGSVFVPADFLDLGGRAAVDQAISRLTRSGDLRRIARGIYDRPQHHPRLGVLSPSLPAVAAAAARATGSRLQVAGALAANQLGLSEQVPAQLRYWTDGTTRTIRVGRQTIELRHGAPRYLAGAGTAGGLVLQAFRYLGQEGVTDDVVARVRDRLAAKDRKAVRNVIRHAPAWMRPALEAVGAPAGVGVSV